MKFSYLQNFHSLDSVPFVALMRHLGFSSVACYRISSGALVQVLSTEMAEVTEAVAGTGTKTKWPAAVSFSSDHTISAAKNGTPPLGWVPPQSLPMGRKTWPKGTTLYFPAGESRGDKLVFAVINASGKRAKKGELHGALEAVCAKILGWYRDHAEKQLVSEAGIQEHLRRLGVDLRVLIEHELRTPLASVAGYVGLLEDLDPSADGDAWREHCKIIAAETGNALEALDKLSVALYSDQHIETTEPAFFDAAEELRILCAQAGGRAVELVGGERSQRVKVQFRKTADLSCVIEADKNLFNWAIWEVVKNAIIHSRSGHVGVAIYVSDRMLVIDIDDDGSGVSAGSEELIFLRFFQDPGTAHLRRGKRGLGLGLFLARHIVERHLGRLTFIRQRSASLFRFTWPLPRGAMMQKLDKGA